LFLSLSQPLQSRRLTLSISDRFAFDSTLFHSLSFRSAIVVLKFSLACPTPVLYWSYSSTMVALSPRFTFLATICVLAALSSAPVSDAAVLRSRASDPALANMAPGHWFRSHSSRVADLPAVLPLPKIPVESHKKSADSSDSPSSSGNKNDQKVPSAGGSHGEKDVSSDGDNGGVHEEGGKIRVRIF
jgi:hypothetical protein